MDVAEVPATRAIAFDEWQGGQRFEASLDLLVGIQKLAQETGIEPAQHCRGVKRSA
jgi:hypothetical protein